MRRDRGRHRPRQHAPCRRGGQQRGKHARFGGVVPEVASRAHLEAMVPTIERAAETAGIRWRTSTRSPSPAAPASPARCWSASPPPRRWRTAWQADLRREPPGRARRGRPARARRLPGRHAMLVSGGHSACSRSRHDPRRRPIGTTIDDAAGEAFDKVARVLGLPFPGGPHIDRAALVGNRVDIEFPRGLTARRDLERHRFDFRSPGSRPRSPAGWRPAARRRADRRVPTSPRRSRRPCSTCSPARRSTPSRAMASRTSSSAAASQPTPGSGRSRRNEPRRGRPRPRPASRPLHRQRRDGRGARRRARGARPYAVAAGPAGRLVHADHHRRRLIRRSGWSGHDEGPQPGAGTCVVAS